MHDFSYFKQSYEIGVVIIPVLLNWKARFREVTWPIRGHTYSVCERFFEEQFLYTTQQLDFQVYMQEN